jgi:DDE superfamily endonuclease
MTMHLKNTSYASLKLQYEARVHAALGGVKVFPPRQTVDRWGMNAQNAEPIKLPKAGRAPVFGREPQKLLLQTLLAIRKADLPVNWHTTRRHTLAIAQKLKLELPPKFPSRSWCKVFARTNGLRRRKVTKAGRKESPADAEAVKKRYLMQTAYLVQKHCIPKALVINADETAVALIDLGKYTLEKEGAKQVRVLASGDKRNITLTTMSAADGTMAPLQCIWGGKEGSKKAIPKGAVPADWLQHQTMTHWQNANSFLEYCEVVVVPFIEKKRTDLGLPGQTAMFIVDTHASHLSTLVRALCKKNRILLRFIVPGYTDRLQPQDLGINNPFKNQIRLSMTRHFDSRLAKWMAAHPGDDTAVVQFEQELQKSKLGKPFQLALVEAFEYIAGEGGKQAHIVAFADYQCCWDEGFRKEAARLQATGLLFDRSGNARGEEVLEVLLQAADNQDEVDEEDVALDAGEGPDGEQPEAVHSDEDEDGEPVDYDALNWSADEEQEKNVGEGLMDMDEEEEEEGEEEVLEAVAHSNQARRRSRSMRDGGAGPPERFHVQESDNLDAAERQAKLRRRLNRLQRRNPK